MIRQNREAECDITSINNFRVRFKSEIRGKGNGDMKEDTDRLCSPFARFPPALAILR